VSSLHSTLAVCATTLQVATSIALPWIVLRWDLRQLSPERLARSWPDTTLLASVVAFGPWCVFVHFARTRRSVLGLLQGLGWTFGTAVLSGLVGLAAPCSR
jgi:hypothetical protein